MKKKVIAIVSVLSAVLLAVGPWTLFRACPTTEKVMKCHWCCKALIPVAILLITVSVLQYLAKEPKSLRLLGVIGVIGFIMPILLTTVLIGGCAKAEMACNVLTFPIVNVISATGTAVQVFSLFGKAD